MKKERRTPVPLIIAFVLFSAVLISSHFTSGMLARYIVEVNNGDDSRVAAFGVEASAEEEDPVTITSDGTDENGITTYIVTVKNTGEVAAGYEATVTFTGDDSQENEAKFDDSDDKLTFTGQLVPGEEAQETITFDMSEYFETNDKWSTYSNDDISGESGEVPFTVVVTFTQID